MNLDLSQNKDQQDQRSELTRHIIYIINNFYEYRKYLKKVPLLLKMIKKVILWEMEKSRFYCTLYPNKDITPILFPSAKYGNNTISNNYNNLILNFYNSLIKLEESLN